MVTRVYRASSENLCASTHTSSAHHLAWKLISSCLALTYQSTQNALSGSLRMQQISWIQLPSIQSSFLSRYGLAFLAHSWRSLIRSDSASIHAIVRASCLFSLCSRSSSFTLLFCKDGVMILLLGMSLYLQWHFRSVRRTDPSKLWLLPPARRLGFQATIRLRFCWDAHCLVGDWSCVLCCWKPLIVVGSFAACFSFALLLEETTSGCYNLFVLLSDMRLLLQVHVFHIAAWDFLPSWCSYVSISIQASFHRRRHYSPFTFSEGSILIFWAVLETGRSQCVLVNLVLLG